VTFLLFFLGVYPFSLAHAQSARPDLMVTQAFPPDRSVPQGAQRVAFLRLTFTVSCRTDFLLRSLRFDHSGLGAPRDIDRVYAVDALGRRITGVQTPATEDGNVLLRFRTMPMPACSTVQLHILADMASNAATSGEHRFFIATADGVQMDGASVSLETSDSPAPFRIVPANAPVIDVRILAPPPRITYGTNRLLARFALRAEVDNQQVYAVTLQNEGSARDADVRNLSLRTQTGDTSSQVQSSLTGESVRLAFDPPLHLERKRTYVLQLRGDVRSSSRRTIAFTISEPSDVEAKHAKHQRK
jgi:hypothetical protein